METIKNLLSHLFFLPKHTPQPQKNISRSAQDNCPAKQRARILYHNKSNASGTATQTWFKQPWELN